MTAETQPGTDSAAGPRACWLENAADGDVPAGALNGACVPVALGPGQGKSIQFGPGEHLLFRATAETTAGQFSLFELTAQPVPGPPEHVHSGYDETYCVLEGRFAVKLGERVVELCPGSFVFIPRGVAHTFRNLDARRSRLLVLTTPGGIEHLYEEARSHMWTHRDPEALRPLLARFGIEIVGPPLDAR